MGVNGKDGVQKLSLVHMVFVFGNASRETSWLSPDFFGMMWLMVQEWSFGMMCGVEIILLRRLFFFSLEFYFISRSREASLEFTILADWELKSLALFMDMIYSMSMRGEGRDKICWKCAKSRGFEVRGYYCSFFPSNVIHSFGKWCGKWRSLLGWHSFHGLLLWVSFYW